jgi:serine/threonine protein kinase
MPADHAGGLRPGDTLGRYQILRELAMGGMAELYVARHILPTGFEKVVVIKRVLPNLSRDEGFVRMFLNEARVAASLDHSNIVHVIDFGRDGREHFLAMEYVHGKAVHQLLREISRGAGIPIDCALTIARGVAQALHYTHERTGSDGRPMGLVHRDVSPSNILVSYEGEVKLTDFGIATATALTRATRTGSIKGKLSYMAPEQVKGEDLDRRADVFSLGVVLYELTTGRRCFYAPGEFALINRVVGGKFERPSRVRPGFPAALEEIIVRALEVDRDRRFATAREFQLALESYATAQGIQLSSVELSSFMSGLFGYEDYPQTSQLPRPVANAPDERGRTLDNTLWRRWRTRRAVPALLIAGGLGVAVGLGVGIGMGFEGDDAVQEATVAAEPPPEEPPEPGPEPAEVAEPPTTHVVEAARVGDAPAMSEAAVDVVVVEDEEAPVAAEPRSRRGKRNGKRTRTGSKGGDRKRSPTDVGWLPPSRRR